MNDEKWKRILTSAYNGDSYSKMMIDRFNLRIQTLQRQGLNIEDDAEAQSLHAGLVLAVTAYLEGKPVSLQVGERSC